MWLCIPWNHLYCNCGIKEIYHDNIGIKKTTRRSVDCTTHADGAWLMNLAGHSSNKYNSCIIMVKIVSLESKIQHNVMKYCLPS